MGKVSVVERRSGFTPGDRRRPCKGRSCVVARDCDGGMGMELLARETIDLAIIDYLMPE